MSANGDAVDTGQSGAARSTPTADTKAQEQVFAKFRERAEKLKEELRKDKEAKR